MQYDINKELREKSKVVLTWHGDDTTVLLDGEREKRPVPKGSDLKVSMEQARCLLRYSNLWTLKGDEPVKHPFDEMMAGRLKAEQRAAKAEPQEEQMPTATEVESMEKAEIVATLRKLNASFNDQASAEELRGLLSELTS